MLGEMILGMLLLDDLPGTSVFFKKPGTSLLKTLFMLVNSPPSPLSFSKKRQILAYKQNFLFYSPLTSQQLS